MGQDAERIRLWAGRAQERELSTRRWPCDWEAIYLCSNGNCLGGSIVLNYIWTRAVWRLLDPQLAPRPSDGNGNGQSGGADDEGGEPHVEE